MLDPSADSGFVFRNPSAETPFRKPSTFSEHAPSQGELGRPSLQVSLANGAREPAKN